MTTTPIARPQLSVAARLVQLIDSWPNTPATDDAPHTAATDQRPDAMQIEPRSITDERQH